MQILLAIIFVALVFSYFFFRYFEKIRKDRNISEQERKRESLRNLLNTLHPGEGQETPKN